MFVKILLLQHIDYGDSMVTQLAEIFRPALSVAHVNVDQIEGEFTKLKF